ncbi:VOC family protein [Ferrimonas marina]|uniref:Uncharacterized conserved protein PhnB, glyoxalase superfamily n=1 Tax=Ferrimonas marina TaxID=299255 RepID=A0A1M5X8N7_9GAMM|nr:VOC family protein [Ferrimonas marina]SHH96012.1 Uncharacterized conserved protein PhnB, glyoxalase superfamily [Ferrimonas marina]
MSQFKPHGVPTLMPYLMAKDVQQAIDFYHAAFGFELADQPMEENGVLQHAEMTFGEARIMMGREGAWESKAQSPASSGIEQGTGLYLYCEDVDAHCEQARRAGAEITLEVDNMFWGDRMYAVKDNDGYRWSFATWPGDQES